MIAHLDSTKGVGADNYNSYKPEVTEQVHERYVHSSSGLAHRTQTEIGDQQTAEEEEAVDRVRGIANCLKLPVFHEIPRNEHQVVCKSNCW